MFILFSTPADDNYVTGQTLNTTMPPAYNDTTTPQNETCPSAPPAYDQINPSGLYLPDEDKESQYSDAPPSYNWTLEQSSSTTPYMTQQTCCETGGSDVKIFDSHADGRVQNVLHDVIDNSSALSVVPGSVSQISAQHPGTARTCDEARPPQYSMV